MPAVYTRHLVSIQMLYVERPEPDRYWKEKAACSDKQSLFLQDFNHKSIAEKRRNEQLTQSICIGCPVRAHCLWAALDTDEQFYMWGGLNPDQRRALRRKLRLKDENVA